ncbi:hypothetical protein KXQ62_004674, partial [Salmonella enterica]|nr:hypothetical protein [Salmonella enterica]
MAKTKSEIFALIGANFPDNQSRLITPEKLREVTTQIADSMLYGVKEVEVLRAASTDIQAPTTTGTALTVSFGGAQGTSADPVMINASGVVTFNAVGNYAIRVKLQAGRTGASGTSILLSRVLLGGAQFGSPAATKLASADATIPIESRVVVNAVAGQNFSVETMRDAAGSNFGGLYPQTATVTSWGVTP